MADVRLQSLTKTFEDITALRDINVEVQDHEFFILLGPTGAGKTTMLRAIAGLEKPDQGEIYIDNTLVNEFTPALRDVAFVFQYYTLYPHYTVRQNLEFPLKSKLRNFPQQEIDQRIQQASETLHISHLLDRQATHLSGGEMQRVAIGRAIVRNPKVFLMDEPLSNLDAKLREGMRAELAHLHLDLGATFFYVTHDQTEAMAMGDRIAVLNKGEILQIGTPDEIYNTPQNTFVARFVGSPMINLLDATIENGSLVVGNRDMICSLTDEQQSKLSEYTKERVVLGIRPEDIGIARESKEVNSFKCQIHFMQSMGAEDILNLTLGKTEFRAIVPPRLMSKVGETVYANLNMGRTHIFDPDTEERLN
ncbi:MAG: ABC transporter ATP-binding protein [bacterium]|nr:ABC transporter ATP-binding protein [bacterium]